MSVPKRNQALSQPSLFKGLIDSLEVALAQSHFQNHFAFSHDGGTYQREF